MAHRLAPVAALALVGVGLVDGVEVCPEANLARTHLCNHRADHSGLSGLSGLSGPSGLR